jgi:hypothetical protein
MDNENPVDTGNERPCRQGSTEKKKMYSKPEFRFERVFETQALSCGKIDFKQLQCRTNRKNS